MDLSAFSPEVQRIILELLERNVITTASLTDKTLLNYLESQKLDVDYISSMMKDR